VALVLLLVLVALIGLGVIQMLAAGGRTEAVAEPADA